MAKQRGAGGRPDPEPLHVDSHRALVAKRRTIVKVLEQHPELLPLLALNPVEAFREAGVTFSPDIADHVLHTTRLPTRVREVRARLHDSLAEALGEDPRPTSPSWVARALFRILEVTPLETKGTQPAYRSSIDPDAEARLASLLKPYHRVDPDDAGVPLFTERRSVAQLDLAAPVPDLPRAAKTPSKVTLQELWFYRGSHELVAPLLRLGVIDSGGVPTVTKATYRRIRSGQQRHQLTAWVRSVTFPKTGRDR